MVDLDKIDYKILQAIAKNSRLSLKKIAAYSNLSKENTLYRLNRLKKIGLLKSTNAIINTEALGFKQYALFLHLTKLTKDKESKIINYLKNNENISWIGITAGKWSIILDIYAKNENNLSIILHKILDLFSNYISEYSVLLLEDKEYFLNKFIKSNIEKEENPIYKKIKYNNTDLKILKLLNENSRISYADLSRKLNLSGNAIKKRIKQLKEKNLILGYTINVNPKSFGYELCGFQLKLLKFDKISINKIINFFKENKKIIFYYKYTPGFWDFDIAILIKDSSEIREFINEIQNKFADIIKINDFYLLLEEITEYKLPEAVFKFE